MGAADAQHLCEAGLGSARAQTWLEESPQQSQQRWETVSHPNAEDHGVVLKAALGQRQVFPKRLRVTDFGFLVYKTQNSEDLGLMRPFLDASAD